MNEPTEGVWTFYDAGWDDKHERDAAIVTDLGICIARCPRYTNREQWKADARLIITSKKLAMMLNDIVTKVDQFNKADHSPLALPLVDEAIALLKEAGVYHD